MHMHVFLQVVVSSHKSARVSIFDFARKHQAAENPHLALLLELSLRHCFAASRLFSQFQRLPNFPVQARPLRLGPAR